MTPDQLERRRARVIRLAAKRPAVTVEVAHAQRPGFRDRLVDLLVTMLDDRRRSGRGWQR